MVITENHCFYPDRFIYFDPASRGYLKEDLCLNDQLSCWFVRPITHNQKQATIVHLHGNAENMTSHITGSLFLLDMGYNLLTFDYSGYGRSRGKPTLKGIQDDARTVFRHIFDNPEIFGDAVFGFGQSMGAYTLARILPDFPSLNGAILEAGLYSFYDLFVQAYPQFQCSIPNEGLSALDKLPLSTVPKLFIHGTNDAVVPYQHSIKMHEVAAEPKELMVLDGVGHMEAFVSQHARVYREKIFSFIEELL
jgi:pimeloyl-ACP methyl ester carboxylesterase